MASDEKKTKTDPAPKKEAAVETKNTEGTGSPKGEGGAAAAAVPSSYSRGEGQKPVSQSYRDNWSAIFEKKKKKKKSR